MKLNLFDIVGQEYAEAVRKACSFFSDLDKDSIRRCLRKEISFYPKDFYRDLVRFLPRVGKKVSRPLECSAAGAGTAAFQQHTKTAGAPLSGLGFYRIGEDGRLYLTTKSEHYHAPLGHGFPGYRLLDHARSLGIPNATHNNTRGHITRLLEQELIRTAAGIAPDDIDGLNDVLQSRNRFVLNRVLNLETGSLAVEAALKMCLSRFYRPQPGCPRRRYPDRIPVFVVIGDDAGDLTGNYHGTTTLTQLLRGMRPELSEKLEKQKILLIRAARPNHGEDLDTVFENYEKPPYKIAGFFYEIVMMNYAAKRLSEEFVRRIHALCKKHDVPTIVDEIQTCVWSPQLFLFREYGVKPTFVAVGKGFPGGEYPASRILFSAAMDTLPQFGALVTNGQEELSSLAYLITLRWVEANGEVIQEVGEYYENRLRDLATKYPDRVCAIEGKRHLAGIYFHDLNPARSFVEYLNQAGLDISVQTYKSGCPPCALTKLPLIAGFEVVDFVVDTMDRALGESA